MRLSSRSTFHVAVALAAVGFCAAAPFEEHVPITGDSHHRWFHPDEYSILKGSRPAADTGNCFKFTCDHAKLSESACLKSPRLDTFLHWRGSDKASVMPLNDITASTVALHCGGGGFEFGAMVYEHIQPKIVQGCIDNNHIASGCHIFLGNGDSLHIYGCRDREGSDCMEDVVYPKPKLRPQDCLELRCGRVDLFPGALGCWNNDLTTLVRQHAKTRSVVTPSKPTTPSCPAVYTNIDFSGVPKSQFEQCLKGKCWIVPAKVGWALQLQGCTKLRDMACEPL